MTHEIVLRKAGKYDVCAKCYRGVVQKSDTWTHIRRVAWKPEFAR